jgi:hypothetical protein
MANDDPVVIELLERCRRDHHAWINGDGSGYALPEDGTILGGIGGYGFGGSATAERQEAVARQWRSGTGDVELLNAAVDGDIAWLAMIERGQVIFDADDAVQRWDLRVTEIFRRVGRRWERVHRHADPLVDRHSLAEVAALLS